MTGTSRSKMCIRDRSQAGAIIPPDRFIPVFERKYMIDRLDPVSYTHLDVYKRQQPGYVMDRL